MDSNVQTFQSDSNIAAILSVMDHGAPASRCADASSLQPMKDTRMAILKLIALRPRPTLLSIAAELALPMRSVKKHLQILFYANTICPVSEAYRGSPVQYELTPTGKKWVDYDFRLTGRRLIYRRLRKPHAN